MNFDKGVSKFEKKMFVCVCVKNVCVCVCIMCVCVERGGGSTLTPKLYAKLCQLRSNTEIHNVKHVVNSTFLNLKTNFELSTKCILTKNLNLKKNRKCVCKIVCPQQYA